MCPLRSTLLPHYWNSWRLRYNNLFTCLQPLKTMNTLNVVVWWNSVIHLWFILVFGQQEALNNVGGEVTFLLPFNSLSELCPSWQINKGNMWFHTTYTHKLCQVITENTSFPSNYILGEDPFSLHIWGWDESTPAPTSRMEVHKFWLLGGRCGEAARTPSDGCVPAFQLWALWK